MQAPLPVADCREQKHGHLSIWEKRDHRSFRLGLASLDGRGSLRPGMHAPTETWPASEPRRELCLGLRAEGSLGLLRPA